MHLEDFPQQATTFHRSKRRIAAACTDGTGVSQSTPNRYKLSPALARDAALLRASTAVSGVSVTG
jgi:hypothetical protein